MESRPTSTGTSKPRCQAHACTRSNMSESKTRVVDKTWEQLWPYLKANIYIGSLLAGCGCSNQGNRRHTADGQAADFNAWYGARILNGCRSASGLLGSATGECGTFSLERLQETQSSRYSGKQPWRMYSIPWSDLPAAWQSGLVAMVLSNIAYLFHDHSDVIAPEGRVVHTVRILQAHSVLNFPWPQLPINSSTQI